MLRYVTLKMFTKFQLVILVFNNTKKIGVTPCCMCAMIDTLLYVYYNRQPVVCVL
jgi:hypothetical protein